MLVESGDTETATGGSSVTVACAEDEGFAAAVARIVTAPDAGIAAGAVNTPAALIVPAAADPPFVPFTAHVTALFALPVTVPTNTCVPPRGTMAETGDTETVTGATTVTRGLCKRRRAGHRGRANRHSARRRDDAWRRVDTRRTDRPGSGRSRRSFRSRTR